MENRICPACKTENEPEYTYCKNCGTPLSVPEPAQKVAENTASVISPHPTGDTQSENPCGVFIDGNSIDKVVTFVGKNADKIVPKFIKIDESGSKIQWCWPPFIWGFFLGPIGVAIWFLYRKMYKPACIFGAVGILANYILEFVNRIIGITDATASSFDNYFKSFLVSKQFDLEGFINTLNSRDILISNLLNQAENALNIACALVAGLFGIYIYKKFAARKILAYRPITNDPNYVKIGLSAAGGTSVGAAILGAIIISVIANVPSFIFSIIKLVRSVYGL